MGLLAPDFSGPVSIKLDPDDVKREALGRVLGIAGAVAGVAGTIMFLTANPAFKSALSKKAAFSMTLSAEEAKRDALGKSLALLGTGIGVIGTGIAMSGNPKMRAKMPWLAKITEPTMLAAVAGLVGVGMLIMIRSQNKALMEQRYGAA